MGRFSNLALDFCSTGMLLSGWLGFAVDLPDRTHLQISSMDVNDWSLNMKKAARRLAIGAGLLASAYCAYVGVTWYRYGRHRTSGGDDPLLNEVMPDFDIAERHHIE